MTFLPNSTFYQLLRGFLTTFATGVACWQGTLTPPDTWSFPIWNLQMFFSWDHWHSIEITPPSQSNNTTKSWPIPCFLSNLTPFLELTPPTDDTSLIWLLTEFDITKNGFHGVSVTGVACRRRKLIPPDTWPRPIWYTWWDQFLSRTCRIFFQTIYFEHPSVLFRFCL